MLEIKVCTSAPDLLDPLLAQSGSSDEASEQDSPPAPRSSVLKCNYACTWNGI